MIMCPCVGGLSHNGAKKITRNWARAGAKVLLHAVAETAGIEGVRQDAQGCHSLAIIAGVATGEASATRY